jgi:hypothetical protein
MTEKYTVICQKWEESERGWGTRPDGYSLHCTEHDRLLFIQEYWDRMPDEAPDEYSRPDGTPYETEVSEALFEQIKASAHGIREFGTPPGSGGTDGWVRC